MDEVQQNKINRIGRMLASEMKGFYGEISFRIDNGEYKYSRVEEVIKQEKTHNG